MLIPVIGTFTVKVLEAFIAAFDVLVTVTSIWCRLSRTVLVNRQKTG